MGDLQHLIHPSHRHRKLRLVTISLAAILVISCLAYYTNTHSRFKVVSKTNSASRYRIEYTVSSRYSRRNDAAPKWIDFGIVYTFKAKPPPQALQWIYSHILRRQVPPNKPALPGWLPGTINQFSISQNTAGITMDKQGYPDVPQERGSMADVKEQRMLIGGQPATWWSVDDPAQTVAVRCNRYSALLIKPEGDQSVFVIVGVDSIKEPTGIAGEMVRIRDSIRIVKVK